MPKTRTEFKNIPVGRMFFFGKVYLKTSKNMAQMLMAYEPEKTKFAQNQQVELMKRVIMAGKEGSKVALTWK